MTIPVLYKALYGASVAVRTDGVLQWILPDHIGSTSTTANADGTLNSVIQYTTFGEIRSTQGVTPTKYRYTGQLAQAELGLDYYVSRWYDPVLDHFTQADTLIPEPGEAQAFDRYAYVQNNPLRYNDPSGHKESGECDDGVGEKCRKKKKVVVPPKPPEPRCKVGIDCQTETPTATSTTTPFRFQINNLFAPSSTPTPKTVLNSGPTSTPIITPTRSPEKSQESGTFGLEVNWDNVDKTDAVIDVLGIIGDIAINKPPEGSIGWIVSDVLEGVSLVKTGSDLFTGNPSNATLKVLEPPIRYVLVLARLERLIPRMGVYGNLISLGLNIGPNISKK